MADKASAGEGTRFRLYEDGPVVTASDEDIAAMTGGSKATGQADVPTLDGVKADAQQRAAKAAEGDSKASKSPVMTMPTKSGTSSNKS